MPSLSLVADSALTSVPAAGLLKLNDLLVPHTPWTPVTLGSDISPNVI